MSIKHRSSIAVREDDCTRVSKCQRQSEKLQQKVGKGIEQNNETNSIESLQQASTLIADSMKPNSTQNVAVPTTAHRYESAIGMEGFRQSSSSIEGVKNHGKREDGIVFPINEQRFQQNNGMPDFQQAPPVIFDLGRGGAHNTCTIDWSRNARKKQQNVKLRLITMNWWMKSSV